MAIGQDELERKLSNLHWTARSGIFYHQYLSKRYAFCTRLVLFLNVALSGAAVINIVTNQYPKTALLIPILLAILNALSLVLDPSNKMAIHEGLARDWRIQDNEIEALKFNMSFDENLEIRNAILSFMQNFAQIDAREPPTIRIVSEWASDKAAHVLDLDKPALGKIRRLIVEMIDTLQFI
ncbi:hypothetical protein [Tistlia consotensis]|uniref:hypothetical protein n=1 Tax=Tistlia consotensis TaxID=1321365 RepID=UPI00117E2D87|nr:hypothetical protein [Tistlia consotensis]